VSFSRAFYWSLKTKRLYLEPSVDSLPKDRVVARFSLDVQRLLKRPLAGASALRPRDAWPSDAMTRRRILVGLGGVALGGTGLLAQRFLPEVYSGVAGAAAQDISYFRIGGGGVGSRLYQLAGAIAGAITNPPGADGCDDKGPCGVPGLVGLAQTTAGSVENLQSLHDAAIESAVTQADIAALATAGDAPFGADSAKAGLLALARIGAVQVQVLVAGSSSVQSVAELKGKTIGFGPKLRDSAVTGPMVLTAYGITPKKAKFTFDEMQPTIAALVDGEIDALVVVDGTPNPDVAALRYSADARLLPVDGDPAAKLIAGRPYLQAASIPGETYRGQPAVATVEVPILWAAAGTLDPKLVYNLTKALASQVLAGGDKSPIDFALAENTGPLALHPAAKRFYDEHRAAPATSTN
jgi:TRAP transporter TAXI family solute receptor